MTTPVQAPEERPVWTARRLKFLLWWVYFWFMVYVGTLIEKSLQ